LIFFDFFDFLPFYRPPPENICNFHEKKLFSLFLFHPPLHHLHFKYGATKQAKREKINVFRPVSEQNFIPEYIFIFILSSAQIF
jgi:hypothetical protein